MQGTRGGESGDIGYLGSDLGSDLGVIESVEYSCLVEKKVGLVGGWCSCASND